MSRPRFSLVPAAHVYLARPGQVLLQQRQTTGYADGYWVAGAAGHIEPGETALDAAVREAREELGVIVDRVDLTLATSMQRTDGSADPVHQRVDWYFTARRWQGTPTVMEPEKCAAIGWFSLDAIPTVPDYERIVLAGLAASNLAAFTSHGFAR